MESIIKPKTSTTTTTVMVSVPLLTVKSSSSMMVNQSTTTIKPKNKSAKRKNSEKRKEKSRKAARERRSQEAKLFDCIEEILPVPTKILEHLDKASLVRIAINYLKIRSVIEPFNVNNNDTILDESIIDKITIDHSFLNTLNGFLFVLSKNGDIIYLSENVERYLGLNQIDLMGQSIYDYSHPCDHDDIKTFLQPLIDAYNATKSSSSSSSTISSSMDSLSIKTEPLKTTSKSPSTVISSSLNNDKKILDDTNGPYFIRMKCTLTNKGRNLNLKSANYKVIKCHGRMINLEQINPKYANLIGENYRHYMIVIADVIQHPIRMEIPLKSDLFISKHLPNMKFSYVDENIKELFGYNVNELIGTSFYQYFDGNDCKQLSILFKTLFSKGQCDFGQYKFLVKTGGYRWITTQATIINEPNSSRPQSIILIHQVISNIENGHLLTSDLQQQQQQQLTINSAIRSDNISTVCNNNNNNISLSPIAPSLNHHSVVSTTSSIIESSIKHHHHQQQQQQQQTSFPCQQKSVSISIPELANIECPSLSTTIVSSSTASLVAVPALINDQQHPPLISPPLPTTSTNSSFITKIKEEKQDQESEKQQLKQKLLQQQQQLVEPICQPQSITDQFISSTEQVLAPKTADMESGFLVFTEDNNGLTVLNDADDLTHLAPDAGDLCVPMFPDMDFTDMNIFDEIFLNSSSFNISANGGVLSEDEFLNNLVSLDPNINDKLKLDSMDNIGMDFENQFMMKRFPTETTFSDLNNHHSVNNSVKDSLKSNGLDMNSNDPFLSFTNDDFLLSNSPNGSRSDCSMGELSFISSNDSSPSSSSSSSSQYSPKSISDDSMGKLCDNNNNNLNDDKDLEMRAPFIPIDDDYLLNDFPCSNLDDLFDWISNTNINNNNNDGNNNLTITNNNNGGNNNTKLNCFNDPFNRQQQFSTTTNNNNNSKKSSLPKLNNGGCLEALLQNDQLIRNLKNKIYSSSNQILQQQQQFSTTPSLKINNNSNNDNNSLNREQFRQQLQQRQQQILHDTSNVGNDDNNLMTTFTNNENIILNNNNNNRSATPTATTTMKRKNSNIYVYTTMTQTGEKKIKNLILTPEIPTQKMIINNQNSNGNCTTTTTTTNGNTNTASIHHFVLTKNNELIPKVAFINQQQQQQQQQFKVPKQLAIPNINQTAINIASITSQQSQPQTNEIIIKENVFKKPRSSESMVKNFSSNSVLLNLLVKGSDLNNGYELSYPNNNNNGSSNSSSPLSSPSSSSSSSSSSSLFNSPISIKLSSSDLIHSANSNNNNNCLLVTTTTSNQNHLNHMALSSTGMVTTSGTMIKNHL
ncbi:uncharacterized protein LOC113793765 isoform X2 [Dermatophagoides pteronyssinus]|uniref:uncharacterized protein LOC113793765 isoform X2 n=1 Tax=Dermatophagoides pteronyssinus TaxID=6956 RepID=UPI003F66B18B